MIHTLFAELRPFGDQLAFLVVFDVSYVAVAR